MMIANDFELVYKIDGVIGEKYITKEGLEKVLTAKEEYRRLFLKKTAKYEYIDNDPFPSKRGDLRVSEIEGPFCSNPEIKKVPENHWSVPCEIESVIERFIPIAEFPLTWREIELVQYNVFNELHLQGSGYLENRLRTLPADALVYAPTSNSKKFIALINNCIFELEHHEAKENFHDPLSKISLSIFGNEKDRKRALKKLEIKKVSENHGDLIIQPASYKDDCCLEKDPHLKGFIFNFSIDRPMPIDDILKSDKIII